MDLQVLDLMPDVVILCDRAGSIRHVNRTIQTLFGYEPAELVGAPIDVLIPARYRAAHSMQLESYFAAPRARPMGLGLELTALRKDGHEFPVDISLAPLQIGGDTYSIAAVRDITERKTLEQRERQLRAAEEEIHNRDKILAIASHELRTPVGSMQLQVGLLQRAATATATELNAIRDRTGGAAKELDSIRDRMVKLEGHARRLGRLIEQLIDSAHVRFGQLPLRVEDTDLTQLTHEAVASLRDEIVRTGSELTVHAEAPVPGRWDPIRIEQVIANLLANAAKFGQGKPITVTVEGDPDRARVSVEDQGPGIARDDHERIFEQFERATTAGSVLGLGLGLYIVRQIVQAHGGAIRLRSSLGSGSTFTVELPREPAPPGSG